MYSYMYMYMYMYMYGTLYMHALTYNSSHEQCLEWISVNIGITVGVP